MKRGREELALLVVDQLFEERAADPLGQGADELAVDDHRVDGVADVVGDGVLAERRPRPSRGRPRPRPRACRTGTSSSAPRRSARRRGPAPCPAAPARRRARARGRSPRRSGTPRTWTRAAVEDEVVGVGLQQRGGHARGSCARTLRAASTAAGSATAAPRLAKPPTPNGTRALSPWTTVIASGGHLRARRRRPGPSVVSIPCPTAATPE